MSSTIMLVEISCPFISPFFIKKEKQLSYNKKKVEIICQLKLAARIINLFFHLPIYIV